MRVKIPQIAAHAGVSRATVDRVLNRRGGVSLDKERAVLQSARLLGLDRKLDARPVKTLRVCVLMKPPQNPFYERLERGFREANLLLADYAVRSYVTYIDVLAPDTIQRQLRTIASNYDALVIVAPAQTSILDELRGLARRLPVITLATDLPLDVPHYYVGPSNRQAGRLAGELMGRMLGPPGGKVLLVAGLQEFSGHAERRIGFFEVLAQEYPNCALAAEIDTLDQHGGPIAKTVFQSLRENPDIKGIYNISQGNDEIAVRIEQLRAQRHLIFICHDLTPTTRDLLATKKIDVVIDQDPLLEARRAIEIVLGHSGRLVGFPIEGRTPLRVVFRESVDADEVPH
jgi:LacI family transcriptional regulator